MFRYRIKYRTLTVKTSFLSGGEELVAILEDLKLRTKEQSSKLITLLRRRDQVKYKAFRKLGNQVLQFKVF